MQTLNELRELIEILGGSAHISEMGEREISRLPGVGSRVLASRLKLYAQILADDEETESIVKVKDKRQRRRFFFNRDRDGNKTSVTVLVPTGEYTLPIGTYRAFLRAYSRWNGSAASIAEVSDRILHLTPAETTAIARALNLTHWSAPLDDETVAYQDIDDLAEQIAADRRADLFKAARKRTQALLEKDALKWRNIEESIAEAVASSVGNYAASQHDIPRSDTNKIKNPESWALVSCLSDVHVGKRGNPAACGPHSANIAQTVHDLNSSIDDLLRKIDCFGAPDKVFLAINGDWFNSDTFAGTTTRGTPQNNDGHPTEAIKVGIELGLSAIDRYRAICRNVEVLVVPGNHDRLSLLMAGHAWGYYYRTVEGVDVILCEAPRTYRRYGRSLLAFLHGDTVKTKLLPELVLSEARQHLSFVDYIRVFMGHFHHKKTTTKDKTTHLDLSGIVLSGVSEARASFAIEQQPSISGEDEYHSRAGYAGSVRGILGHLISSGTGPIGQLWGLPSKR